MERRFELGTQPLCIFRSLYAAFENTWKTMKGREREREKERKRERETDREEYLARQKPLVA